MERLSLETTRIEGVFPFIVGCGRSGTTLLRAMINTHPEMAIPFESYFIVSMGQQTKRYEDDGAFAGDRFIADLLGDHNYGVRQWGVPDEEIRQALGSTMPRTFGDAVRQLFALYARRNGKTRYGDKTPNYVGRIPLIARILPEARFVHIVRDGRDVALAWLDAPWGFESLPEAALHWTASVDAGLRGGRWIGPERYREVRYEDLVREPEQVLKTLCPFLGIAYDDSMLRYYDHTDVLVASDPHPENQRSLLMPPTVGLRDWRRQMDADDARVFESIGGDVLEKLGYELMT